MARGSSHYSWRTSWFTPLSLDIVRAWVATLPETRMLEADDGSGMISLDSTGSDQSVPDQRWDEEAQDYVEFEFHKELQLVITPDAKVTVQGVGFEDNSSHFSLYAYFVTKTEVHFVDLNDHKTLINLKFDPTTFPELE